MFPMYWDRKPLLGWGGLYGEVLTKRMVGQIIVCSTGSVAIGVLCFVNCLPVIYTHDLRNSQDIYDTASTPRPGVQMNVDTSAFSS